MGEDHDGRPTVPGPSSVGDRSTCARSEEDHGVGSGRGASPLGQRDPMVRLLEPTRLIREVAAAWVDHTAMAAEDRATR